MPEKNIVIVGGGLVGSLWSLLQAKRGHKVRVYEKRSDIRRLTAEEGRSINLVVTSRGIEALQMAGIWDEVSSITKPIYGRTIHDQQGLHTWQPYGRDTECNYSISRRQLNGMLMDQAEAAGVEFFFEHAFETMDFRNRSMSFSTVDHNTISIDADIFFGADGGGGGTRAALCAFLKSEGVKDVSEDLIPLSAGYKELFMPAGANGQPQVEQKGLHIWPRGSHMLMGLANLDGSFTMTLYMPRKGELSFEQLKTDDQVSSFFQEYYPDAVPLMPNLLRDFQQNPVGGLGTVRCYPWIWSDCFALIGDAAHGIVPFFGQGMNAGFEDLTVLNRNLEEGYSWEETLRRYEKIQKPNGDAIADMALENFVEMRDSVGQSDFQLLKSIEKELESRFEGSYRSRYSMVTFSLNSYFNAKRVGEIQEEILKELADGVQDAAEVDYGLAEKLINERLLVYAKEAGVDFSW